MARPPFPLPHALHPDLVILDEFGRALLPRPDRVHYREELCLDPRPRRRHHRFPGRAQRKSAALRVEGQGRGDPAQDQRRQTGTCRRGTKVTLFQRRRTSGVQSEQYEIRVGMSKIRSSTPVCWTSLPLSRVIRWSRVGSGISSAVTIHGPKPPVAWKFLPAAIECLNWMSRIEPSLKQV